VRARLTAVAWVSDDTPEAGEADVALLRAAGRDSSTLPTRLTLPEIEAQVERLLRGHDSGA
jgi:hypothetical protein